MDEDSPATYDIERFLNVRSAHGASMAADGERLAFLMDTTGVPQVWTVDGPGRWPVQRTFFEERVTFAACSPERDELVFGMDEGGNEREQFHRLDLTDGTIAGLTRQPEAKHHWGGWSHDGEQFAFAANRRDEGVFDIYVQDRTETGEAATLVYESDGWFQPAGWRPDDGALALVEVHASFDQDLHVLDLETGTSRHLTTDTEGVRFRSPQWAPDGEVLYCLTDAGSDTLYLARMDPETGALDSVWKGGDWEVDGLAMDDENGRFVCSRNVDGYTELTVGELGGDDGFETFPTPDLPSGVHGGVSFGPDAERFAVTVTTDTHNANVHVVDVQTGAAERFTDAPTAGIPREAFAGSDLVRIESFDGLEVPGFLTLPDGVVGAGDSPGDADESPMDAGESSGDTGDGADGPAEAGDDADVEGRPVLVDIHGGPESQRRPSFHAVKQYLVHRGYAVFEPNVRGSSGYGREYQSLDDVERRMDSVADIEACVDWLADHPAIDPDRIACMGGSYGGFMVLAAMTEYPDLWAAGVDIVGIANFVTFLENTGDWRRELREAEYGSLSADREFLESISPIHRIEDIQAPLFVIHGENDPRVPVGEARQIVERAESIGVPVRSLIFEDEGHGLAKLENRIEAYGAVADFLDDHV